MLPNDQPLPHQPLGETEFVVRQARQIEELGGTAIAGSVDFSANGVSLEKQEQR
jgi:hypothetical protein